MLILQYEKTIKDAGWTHNPGCDLYALIVNPNTGDAVDFSTGTPYSFDSFDGDNDRFGVTLEEDVIRTRVYNVSLSAGVEIEMPSTEQGEQYEIEFWCQSASGFNDRASDIFLGVERFPWDNDSGTRESQNIIQIRTNTENHTAFCAFSYDTLIERIGICCWLERNGEVVDDSVSCTVSITDSTGITIAEDLAIPIPSPRLSGEFFGEILTQPLNPDETYFAICKITDSSGNIHTSACSPVTWD
jgi:hypothetical protein